MRKIEKEEERVAYDQPDKKVYHLCIVNLVIGYVTNREYFLSCIGRLNIYHASKYYWITLSGTIMNIFVRLHLPLAFVFGPVPLITIYKPFFKNRNYEFKLAVLVYKALNNLDPQHLIDDCQLVAATGRRHQLQSSDNFKCSVISMNSRFCDHAFAAAGPWNSLPVLIRQPALTVDSFFR